MQAFGEARNVGLRRGAFRVASAMLAAAWVIAVGADGASATGDTGVDDDTPRWTEVSLASSPAGSFLTERFPSIMHNESVVRDTLSALGETIKSRGGELAQGLLTSALSVINAVVFVVVVPVVAFYLLLDWDNMVAKIDSWLPRDHRHTIRRLAREVDAVLAAFMRGPRVPTVLGFDPLFQFMHERDAAKAIATALDCDIRGVFNVAGPNPVPLSLLIRETGRSPLPVPERPGFCR